MHAPVDVIGSQRDQTGESPLWSADDQALYWVDITGQQLRRYNWPTRSVQSWPTPGLLACIALHQNGGLIGAMDNTLVHLRPSGGSLSIEVLHELRFPEPGMRFNDGRCDRAGRFWVSSMLMDMSRGAAIGSLYRLDGRRFTKELDGLVTGNGLGFSPDNRRMYLSDSHPKVQRVWRFDLSAHGVLSQREEFIDMNPLPGRPDGAAVDAEGAYWICGNDGYAVHRFMPDGRLERSITVPVAKPAMCAFGGPQLDHLFITSIVPATAMVGGLDGALFITQPGVKGLPETPYNPRTGDTR